MSTPIPPGGGDTPRPLPPSKTPEARRLQRFNSDPRYGPKLSQLPKGEQARILGMVKGNQGKAARKELLKTHTQRKDTKNARARDIRRSKAEQANFRRFFNKIPEARRSMVQQNIGSMEYRHLHAVQNASPEELRERAKAQKPEDAPKDFVIVNGVAINVFWYR